MNGIEKHNSKENPSIRKSHRSNRMEVHVLFSNFCHKYAAKAITHFSLRDNTTVSESRTGYL